MFGRLFATETKESVRSVTPAEVKRMLDAKENATLLDVRTPEEYARGHIGGSVNLPLNLLPARARDLLCDLSAPVVVYCLSGGRSASAASILARLGYSDVRDMGGISCWPYGTVKG